MAYVYAYWSPACLVARIPVSEFDNPGMTDVATWYGPNDDYESIGEDSWVPLHEVEGALMGKTVNGIEYEVAVAVEQHQRERKEYLA